MKKSSVWKILLHNGTLRSYQLGLTALPPQRWDGQCLMAALQGGEALTHSLCRFPRYEYSHHDAVTKGGAGDRIYIVPAFS